MEMKVLLAKTLGLLEVARGTRPPQPNTVQRLGLALQAAVRISSLDNTHFAALLVVSLDAHIDILTGLRKKVDDLAALLQTARHLASITTRRHDSSSAALHLDGLHGDDLFRALMALYLPDTTPADIYLEAALAAQRLIMHDHLDKYVHLYEKILFEANTTVAYEDGVRIFVDHVQSLEKFVREHMDLAVAAVSGIPSTGPPN